MVVSEKLKWEYEMSKLHSEYGSELHLLRYMGRHREELDRLVGAAIGGEVVRWLDFAFARGNTPPDAEPKGIAWSSPDADRSRAWREFWPVTGEQMNWDAVGEATVKGKRAWLMVEAKGHLRELESNCGAKPATQKGGRDQIEMTLNEVKNELGVEHKRSWLLRYYQYCNRLAVLHFLRRQNIPAEMLFVYFTGDTPSKSRQCPRNAQGWAAALRVMHEYVGLPEDSGLRGHVHQLFLPVCPR